MLENEIIPSRSHVFDPSTDRVIRRYRDLAKYLGIGTETARKLMLRKDFPCVNITPHIRVVSVEALEKWLDSRKNSALST